MVSTATLRSHKVVNPSYRNPFNIQHYLNQVVCYVPAKYADRAELMIDGIGGANCVTAYRARQLLKAYCNFSTAGAADFLPWCRALIQAPDGLPVLWHLSATEAVPVSYKVYDTLRELVGASAPSSQVSVFRLAQKLDIDDYGVSYTAVPYPIYYRR